MKKIYFTLFFMLLVLVVKAQHLDKSLVASNSGILKNKEVQLTWTLGDLIVGSSNNGSSMLGSGYLGSLKMEVLSTEDVSIVSDVKIFPNPTSQFLNFSQEEGHELKVEIIDVLGKIIYENKIMSGSQLDVSTYISGIYFLNIKDQVSGKTYRYKFIKQ